MGSLFYAHLVLHRFFSKYSPSCFSSFLRFGFSFSCLLLFLSFIFGVPLLLGVLKVFSFSFSFVQFPSSRVEFDIIACHVTETEYVG